MLHTLFVLWPVGSSRLFDSIESELEAAAPPLASCTVELSSKWDSALDRLQGELREQRLHAPGSGKTEVILMLAHPTQFWLS